MNGEVKFTSLISNINIYNPFQYLVNRIKYYYKFFFNPKEAIKITNKNSTPAVTNGNLNPN